MHLKHEVTEFLGVSQQYYVIKTKMLAQDRDSILGQYFMRKVCKVQTNGTKPPGDKSTMLQNLRIPKDSANRYKHSCSHSVFVTALYFSDFVNVWLSLSHTM